ncbi:MAG: hypothetical protein KTR31_09595 [Myxococcales bacterium]|nr:hypothetical protein [Myxococcales bacterium]
MTLPRVGMLSILLMVPAQRRFDGPLLDRLLESMTDDPLLHADLCEDGNFVAIVMPDGESEYRWPWDTRAWEEEGPPFYTDVHFTIAHQFAPGVPKSLVEGETDTFVIRYPYVADDDGVYRPGTPHGYPLPPTLGEWYLLAAQYYDATGFTDDTPWILELAPLRKPPPYVVPLAQLQRAYDEWCARTDLLSATSSRDRFWERLQQRESDCTDGLDNDRDGTVDCEDRDCASVDCPEICATWFDNDADGKKGCADSDCAMSPDCVELICSDGEDNDEDTLTDCQDPDCNKPGSPCLVPHENTEAWCQDRVDNDGDGALNCDDSDCARTRHCGENTLAKCFDEEDNDRSGASDCADPGCQRFCVESTEAGTCNDWVDNDGDGLVDCMESDCALDVTCNERDAIRCSDHQDNDRDGVTDCEDSDCDELELCTETHCFDGIDNDASGRRDCDDPDCHGVVDAVTGQSCPRPHSDDLEHRDHRLR